MNKKYFMLQLIDGKFDVTAFLAQFNKEELEAFKIEVEVDIKRRKTDDKGKSADSPLRCKIASPLFLDS